jgi:hypothetical protein
MRTATNSVPSGAAAIPVGSSHPDDALRPRDDVDGVGFAISELGECRSQ